MDIPLKKKRFTTSRIGMIVGIVLLIALILFVLISSGGKSQLNVQRERLTISTAKKAIFQENIPVNGVVLPITTIYLDAIEGGRVEEIFVESGAVLKKGDPILRLSNTDLKSRLLNQETSVYRLLTQIQISQNAARQNSISIKNRLIDVKNNFVESKRIFELNNKLYSKGAIGKQEMIKSKNDYHFQKERLVLAKKVLKQDSISTRQELQQVKNSYARAQKALKLMQKKVNDLVVGAPVDGRLTSLDAEIGQSKNKGDRLGQIDVLSGFKVRVDIDEHYISRIFVGQEGTFTFDGEKFKLRIKKVYTKVNDGRFQVDMEFVGEAPEGIRRGQSLQIRLALSQEKEAIIIPKGGFFQETGGNWIFQLSGDGETAYKTPIQLGSQNTEYYEVLQGLQPGDKVITSSYGNYGEVEELVFE